MGAPPRGGDLYARQTGAQLRTGLAGGDGHSAQSARAAGQLGQRRVARRLHRLRAPQHPRHPLQGGYGRLARLQARNRHSSRRRRSGARRHAADAPLRTGQRPRERVHPAGSRQHPGQRPRESAAARWPNRLRRPQRRDAAGAMGRPTLERPTAYSRRRRTYGRTVHLGWHLRQGDGLLGAGAALRLPSGNNAAARRLPASRHRQKNRPRQMPPRKRAA